MTEIIGETTGTLTREQERALKQLTRGSRGWQLAKDNGVDLVSGEPHRAGLEVIELVKEMGIFVLAEGELEAFDRSLDGHSSAWVVAAWSAGIHKLPASLPAQLISKVARSFL